jgi:uncharacterized protein (TIGR02594 family)
MTIAALVAAGPLKAGPLKLPAVFTLQDALIRLGDMTASADGFFGPKTQTAVKTAQRLSHLPETGVVDSQTAAAIDEEVAKLKAPPPVLHMFADPPWFVIMTSLLGIYEFRGAADNPTILGWAKELGGNIAKTYKHDAIPWCALTIQYSLFKAGFPHLDSLWALDMAGYGIKLGGPARGAIGTKTRASGGHTFLIVGRSAAGMLVIRGGNQSDMVCDEDIHPGDLYSVTWPKGYPLPVAGFNNLPLVKDAPRNRREA